MATIPRTVVPSYPLSSRTVEKQIAAVNTACTDLTLPTNVPCLIAMKDSGGQADPTVYITKQNVIEDIGIPLRLDSGASGGVDRVVVTAEAGTTVYVCNNAGGNIDINVVAFR